MYLYFVVKLGTYDWMMSRRKQRYEANSPSNGSNQSTHASRYHQVNSASPHPPREQESSISVNSTSIENVRRQLQREAYERQMRQNQLTRQHSQPKLPQRAGSNSSINQEEIQAPERSFRRGDLGNSSMDAGDVAMTSSRRSSTSVHTTSNSNQHNHHNHNVAPLDLKVIPPKLKLSGTDLLKGLLAKQSPRVSIYPQTVDFYDMERCITDDAESLNYELDQFYVQYQQEELEQQRYQPPVEEEEEEEEHDSSRSVATTKYS